MLDNQDTTNEWAWSDGWPVVYTNWDSEDSSSDAEAACGYMTASGRWMKDNCDQPRHAFCKISLGNDRISDAALCQIVRVTATK